MKTKMGGKRILFRDDLKERLRDPKFRQAFDAADAPVRLAVALAQARVSAGLTQKTLAHALGTKQSNISRMEKGIQNVTVGTLEKIAQALHRKLEIRFRPA